VKVIMQEAHDIAHRCTAHTAQSCLATWYSQLLTLDGKLVAMGLQKVVSRYSVAISTGLK